MTYSLNQFIWDLRIVQLSILSAPFAALGINAGLNGMDYIVDHTLRPAAENTMWKNTHQAPTQLDKFGFHEAAKDARRIIQTSPNNIIEIRGCDNAFSTPTIVVSNYVPVGASINPLHFGAPIVGNSAETGQYSSATGHCPAGQIAPTTAPIEAPHPSGALQAITHLSENFSP